MRAGGTLNVLSERLLYVLMNYVSFYGPSSTLVLLNCIFGS